MDIIFLCSIYQYIYLFVLALISIPVYNKYRSLDGYSSSGYPNNTAAYIVLVIFCLFIGLRPISSLFVDMGAYDFLLSRFEGGYFEFDRETLNLLFDNFLIWWGCNGFNHNLFFLAMATIYFGCSFIGIRRLFPKHYYVAYLVYLVALSTFSYGTNGIKAGAAASLFILAISFMDIKWISIPLALVSWGFHHSMKVVFVAYIIVIFFKNPKYFFYGWFVCLIMSALHITFFQEYFANYTDEHGAGYLLATEETTSAHIGFRPDFILYSAMPVWIGYKYEFKHKYNISKTYSTLLHLYITINAVWLLCMYASFTNRIAYLSWFLYPIVLIYPYLDDNNFDAMRLVKFRKVAIYHMCFTLFMVLVYYGIFQLGN